MQQLNLADPRLLPPQRVLSGARAIALFAAGLLLVTAHFGTERHRMAQALASAGAETAENSNPEVAVADPASALRTRIAQRQSLRDMLATTDTLPPDSAALLQAVIAALPESLWLTEIDITGARGVRIAGGTLDPSALNGFAERLSRIPLLRAIPIETVRVEPQDAAAGGTAEVATPPGHSFVLASAAILFAEAAR